VRLEGRRQTCLYPDSRHRLAFRRVQYGVEMVQREPGQCEVGSIQSTSRGLIISEEGMAMRQVAECRFCLTDEVGLEIDRRSKIENADPDRLLGASSSRGFARSISGGEGSACGRCDGRPLRRRLAGRDRVSYCRLALLLQEIRCQSGLFSSRRAGVMEFQRPLRRWQRDVSPPPTGSLLSPFQGAGDFTFALCSVRTRK
jgi:hypothetical protein